MTTLERSVRFFYEIGDVEICPEKKTTGKSRNYLSVSLFSLALLIQLFKGEKKPHHDYDKVDDAKYIRVYEKKKK